MMFQVEPSGRNSFLQKQALHDNKQPSYYLQIGSHHRRRYSQEPIDSQDSRLPSFHQKPTNSVHNVLKNTMVNKSSNVSFNIDSQILGKSRQLRNHAHSQWEKITNTIPKRVQLNFQELQQVTPNEIVFDNLQPRIHSPDNQKRFQRSFYLGIGKDPKKSQLNLTNSLLLVQEAQQELKTQKLLKIYRYNYIFHYVVGWGGFGKVWKVESKKTRIIYAMKELTKAKILAKKSVKSVLNERNLLTKIKHPFLVNLVASFQDKDNLYLVMDYLSGGDLRFHLIVHKYFKEEQIKFFIACLILGLEYMHLNNVIHRDIKPENLVLDCKGYLRITDLGIARVNKSDNQNETSGTPGYMAPEVLCRQNHSFGVDYFAMGVLTYEMIMGRRPYTGRSRREYKEEVLSKAAILYGQDCPNYSVMLVDFVNKLLQRKPQLRLGAGGIAEIKNHMWFANFAWDRLLSKLTPAPFVPRQEDNRQMRYQEESQITLIAEQYKLLKLKDTQYQFEGYSFNTENYQQKY